jgi:hypothetical protein
MRSEPRRLLKHRLAIIQNRRSALPSRGREYLRCRTSNCCRRQRFSATSRTIDLNAAAIAHTRKPTTPTSADHSRGAKASDCQPPSPWAAILRPTGCGRRSRRPRQPAHRGSSRKKLVDPPYSARSFRGFRPILAISSPNKRTVTATVPNTPTRKPPTKANTSVITCARSRPYKQKLEQRR